MDKDFLSFIRERGFLHQVTNEENLRLEFQKGCVVAYVGFDCTANSLHIGSLVQIMLLRWLQKFGNKPIILLGSATTKIGDPSGKDKVRPLLSEDVIAANKNGIIHVLSKFLKFGDGSIDAIMIDNSEWLNELNYIEFLRDVGKYFSINKMLTFDSVRLRLEREQHLSFLEFNYMVLQAYDFVELNKKYQCILQIGGSDQWGNIICGIDLGDRMHSDMYGITTPLVTTSDGRKMGKTAEGAIWLDEKLCSPYEYWQYFRNVSDDDVIRFLYLFTELDHDEINRLAKLQDKEINEAKKILATEVTAICHGSDAAQDALKAAISEFENNNSEYLPAILVKENIIFKILVEIGFAASNSDAKRKILSGGVLFDDKVITDINFVLTEGGKISFGKRKLLVRLEKKI